MLLKVQDMNVAAKGFITFFLMNFFVLVQAQQPVQPPSGGEQPDRRIQIIRANSMRNMQISDVTAIISLAGDAVVKQGNTIISGDSMAVNQETNIAEVFGHVHINDADSVHTYANYLRYLGNERIAFFKKNVKLTDGRGTLLTDDLEYNVATGIANYKGGGKVINEKTVLTSANATYFSDTKDVYFKNYVHLTDPKYDIKADSLRYNTAFKTATFISPTTIVTEDGGVIRTTNGIYNLETREAQFFDRTNYADSLRSVTGDNIAYQESSGILQVLGQGKIVDSSNNTTVFGDEILLNKFNSSFLATKKPVLVFYKNEDSTYMAADTVFSGLRKYDTITKHTVIINDTINNTAFVNISERNDTLRYFVGFHNVRIFNDSLQAVCDSVYISTEDSVFRMYRDPIVWNGKNQMTGDTMYLFTQLQKPKRVFVFNDALLINQESSSFYNQLGGRTLNGYFTNGELTYTRVKGSPAESIYYVQDSDSAYVGLNRLSADAVDAFFVNQELIKVKYVNKAEGNMYPIKQIPRDRSRLSNFSWHDDRRPKTYLELFE